MTNQERYANKLAVYNQALTKVGYSKIEDKIGKVAASKLDLAQDAFKRQQAEYIIADFLADAQAQGEQFANHDCLYEVLSSL